MQWAKRYQWDLLEENPNGNDIWSFPSSESTKHCEQSTDCFGQVDLPNYQQEHPTPAYLRGENEVPNLVNLENCSGKSKNKIPKVFTFIVQNPQWHSTCLYSAMIAVVFFISYSAFSSCFLKTSFSWKEKKNQDFPQNLHKFPQTSTFKSSCVTVSDNGNCHNLKT
jgi:hypothetical protein